MMLQDLMAAVSAIAAATAAFFSWKAIRENRKNVFLIERNKVALAARKVKLDFEAQWLDYKISENLEDQGTLFSAKYFVEPSLYEKFTSVLVHLQQLEKARAVDKATEDAARDIAKELNEIICNVRLD